MNPKLIAINGSKKVTTFVLESAETSIGRESTNVISLNHSSISRRHCVIRRDDEDFTVYDLGSFNGTFVNEVPVSEQKLSPRDRVRIGNIQLLFVTEETDTDAVSSGESVRLSDADYLTESSKEVRAGSLLQQTQQNMVQFAHHERVARDLAVLLKVATRINRLCHTREIVQELLDSIFEVVPVDRGAILLTDGDKDFSSVYGKHRREHGHPISVGRTVVERVLREGLAFWPMTSRPMKRWPQRKVWWPPKSVRSCAYP